MLLVLLVLSFLLSPGCSLSAESLYSSSDVGTIVLNKSNFNATLFGKDVAFILQFYNSWCGHCIHFVPLWKKFAKNLMKWEPIVKLGTVNCAIENHTDICRYYQIEMFPTIIFFGTNVKAGDLGKKFEGDPGADLNAIRHNFVDFLVNSTKKDLPQNWPLLLPISSKVRSKFFRSMPFGRKKHIFALIEEHGSYTGKELILNFLKYPEVFIRTVETSNKELINFLLPKPLHSFKLPLLLNIECCHSIIITETPNRTVDNISELESDSEFFSHFIREKYLHSTSTIQHQESGLIENTRRVQIFQFDPKNMPVHMTDLYNALRYTLYQEIPLKKTLTDIEVNIVKNYLYILLEYFPFDDLKAYNFIKSLRNHLSDKSNLETSSMVDYMDKILPDARLPHHRPYVTCEGSHTKYRGHPCSMWLLFHTLTVGEYLKLVKMKNPKPNDHLVLINMRDYVSNFFSCSRCAQNFVEMAHSMELNFINSNSSVHWLWKAHNKVNKRLAGDLTEDPTHPKFQYPTKKMCVSCYDRRSNYLPEQVLKFLVNRYRKSGIVRDDVMEEESRKLLNLHEVPEEEEIKTIKMTFFSQSDMNLSLVLYLISIILLCGLFCVIRLRGRRRKLKKFFDFSA